MNDSKYNIKDVEEDLRHIILAFPVYGQHPYYDMIGKVFARVKDANKPEPPKEYTTFTPSHPDGHDCIHCGDKGWNHELMTRRCKKQSIVCHKCGSVFKAGEGSVSLESDKIICEKCHLHEMDTLDPAKAFLTPKK